MKAYLTSVILVLSLFLLAACGTNAAQTEEVELSDVYTAVAETLAAQPTSVQPTATQTVIASPTMFTFSTSIPVTFTPENQVVYSSSGSTANGCNNAAFISDVTIPDGTVLAPEEAFVKTWEFQNTGTCDWNEDYRIVFINGTDMDGETTEIDQDVSTGTTAEISASLIAPSDEGTYTGYWRLADDEGNEFGQSVYVMIVVSDDAATVTPTPTPTTETVESTSTPVPTETATLTPTSMPTATLTETAGPSPTVSGQTE
jgi:hypothetical protein